MEDLQSILEKINREGVEKADAEAKRIIDAAKAKADALVKEAESAAAKTKAESEKAAAAYAERAAETIRQSARDVVIGVKDAIQALLEKLLTQSVEKALADEKTCSDLMIEAIKGLTGPGEVVAGAKLAAAFKAKLAAEQTFTVVTDDTIGTGFTVKLDGGRVEHTFTVETIAAELAKRLRPDLAALV